MDEKPKAKHTIQIARGGSIIVEETDSGVLNVGFEVQGAGTWTTLTQAGRDRLLALVDGSAFFHEGHSGVFLDAACREAVARHLSPSILVVALARQNATFLGTFFMTGRELDELASALQNVSETARAHWAAQKRDALLARRDEIDRQLREIDDD